MAQPTPPPPPTAAKFADPLPVISTQYCTPHRVTLEVVKDVMPRSGGFVVSDTNNTVIFEVKGKWITLHDERVLLDAAGKPIVTFRKKRMTAHHRWNVYRGESKEPSDLIFTIKRSSMIQLKAELHVFLANNNTKEEVCDFIVEATWAEKTCVVYTGDRTKILAKMKKETTIVNALIGNDKYVVTVFGNVDYAFIVALIVILEDMNHISERTKVALKIGMTLGGVPTLASLRHKAFDDEELEEDEDDNDEEEEIEGDEDED